MKVKYFLGASAVALAMTGSAWADNVLIVNGASTTSETGTTADITNNLPATCGASHTYTVVDTPPASLAGYQQIWDLRFSNSSALTAGDRTAYVNFLQSGGRMFVMGENSFFMSRNNSVIQFVSDVGGGALSFVTPGDTQDVAGVPFTNGGLTTIAYNLAGGVTAPGTGTFATSNPTGGTAVAWQTGTLASAAAGALTVVFDVNFMQPSASANERQFFQNLCTFVAVGGGSAAVPADAPWALLSLSSALGILGGVWVRRRRRASIGQRG